MITKATVLGQIIAKDAGRWQRDNDRVKAGVTGYSPLSRLTGRPSRASSGARMLDSTTRRQ